MFLQRNASERSQSDSVVLFTAGAIVISSAGKSLPWGNMGNSRTGTFFHNYKVDSRPCRCCFTVVMKQWQRCHVIRTHGAVSVGFGHRVAWHLHFALGNDLLSLQSYGHRLMASGKRSPVYIDCWKTVWYGSYLCLSLTEEAIGEVALILTGIDKEYFQK